MWVTIVMQPRTTFLALKMAFVCQSQVSLQDDVAGAVV